MDERRNVINVEVFDLTDSEFEMTLPAFMQWIDDKVSKVPEEFRGLIRVVAEDDPYYDRSPISLTASYDRPETDSEVYARIEKNRMQDERETKAREERERREFERLKAKFG